MAAAVSEIQRSFQVLVLSVVQIRQEPAEQNQVSIGRFLHVRLSREDVISPERPEHQAFVRFHLCELSIQRGDAERREFLMNRVSDSAPGEHDGGADAICLCAPDRFV